jgi:hypothetical protein
MAKILKICINTKLVKIYSKHLVSLGLTKTQINAFEGLASIYAKRGETYKLAKFVKEVKAVNALINQVPRKEGMKVSTAGVCF